MPLVQFFARRDLDQIIRFLEGHDNLFAKYLLWAADLILEIANYSSGLNLPPALLLSPNEGCKATSRVPHLGQNIRYMDGHDSHFPNHFVAAVFQRLGIRQYACGLK